MTRLMTIGEFATATWLSAKALRHYDSKGLLSPDAVDPFTRNRKYTARQIYAARLITLLRRIDMPLEDIREVLDHPVEDQAAMIARFREREDDLHARRRSLATFLEHAVVQRSLDGGGQPGESRFELGVRRVPETPILSSTRHTSARELPAIIHDTAQKLFALAEDRGGAQGGLVVIYHGQVGWESDGPIEVSVPIRDHEQAHRIEPAHEQIFTHVPAEDVQFPRILTAFEAVQARATQLGYAPAGPPREIYAAPESGRPTGCEVALPVFTPLD